MQQRFLLQILLLAQHVSGTTMPIMCPICRMLQHPANQTQPSAPHQTSNLKTIGSNHCIILLSS